MQKILTFELFKTCAYWLSTESHQCLPFLSSLKLFGGLYSLTWLKKMSGFRSCLLWGAIVLVLQVEVNWILKPIIKSGLTVEKE